MTDKKPTLCVVAGPNGSGKTTTTVQLLNDEWTADSLSSDHGTALIHIHINHDLFRGRDFLCDGEKPLLLSPNLQFFLLILVHPSIYRHCVRF